jgi:hypothetical protein
MVGQWSAIGFPRLWLWLWSWLWLWKRVVCFAHSFAACGRSVRVRSSAL